MSFRGWYRTRLKIVNSLGVFLAGIELLVLADVDSLALLGQKRDRGKTNPPFWLSSWFLLSAGPSSSLSNNFFIYSLVSNRLCRQCCLVYKFGLSKSRIRDNKKQFLERQQAKETNFCKLTCHLPSSRTCKNILEKHSVLRLLFEILQLLRET